MADESSYDADLHALCGERIEDTEGLKMVADVASSIVRKAVQELGEPAAYMLMTCAGAVVLELGQLEAVYALVLNVAMSSRQQGIGRPAEPIEASATFKLIERAGAARRAGDYDEVGAVVYEAITGHAP